MGKKCYELTHHQSEPCRPPVDICPMKETVATGNYSVAEHVHFRENGDNFYAEVSTAPIFDGSGKVASVVHVSRDITDRKRTEEDVRRLNSELELKVRERTRELIDAQEELVRNEKLSILGQLSGRARAAQSPGGDEQRRLLLEDGSFRRRRNHEGILGNHQEGDRQLPADHHRPARFRPDQAPPDKSGDCP